MTRWNITRDLLLLLAICAGLWGWTYGRWDLWGPDETRYVQVARESLEHGNWLLLTVNHEPYDQKPPLPFWFIAAMLKLTGGEVSSWAVRLPSVLFSLASILMTYWLGVRRFGRETGWLAACLMIAAPLLIAETPSARLDTFLLGFVTLALAAWLGGEPDRPLGAGRVALYWLGTLGGFFIKGPAVFVFTLLPPVVEAAWTRNWRPLRALRPAWGLGAIGLIVAAWMTIQAMSAPAGFIEGQVGDATVSRLFNPNLHGRPPWYYFEVLFADGYGPWMPFLAWGLWRFWKLWRLARRPEASLALEAGPRAGVADNGVPQPVDPLLYDAPSPRERDILRPLLAIVLPTFLFLSIIPGKREQYLLPLFPAMTLLTAWILRAWVFPRRPWRAVGPVLGIVAAVAGLLGAAATLTVVYRPGLLRAVEFHPTLMQLIVICYGFGLLALLGWAYWSARDWQRIVRLTMVLIYFGSVVIMAAVNPGLNQGKSSRQLASEIDRFLPREGNRVIGALGDTLRPQYQVYGSFRMLDLDSDPQKLWDRAHRKPLPEVIIAEPEDLQKVGAMLRDMGYILVYREPHGDDPISVFVRQPLRGPENSHAVTRLRPELTPRPAPRPLYAMARIAEPARLGALHGVNAQ